MQYVRQSAFDRLFVYPANYADWPPRNVANRRSAGRDFDNIHSLTLMVKQCVPHVAMGRWKGCAARRISQQTSENIRSALATEEIDIFFSTKDAAKKQLIIERFERYQKRVMIECLNNWSCCKCCHNLCSKSNISSGTTQIQIWF
jgi:hypothetical protein